MTLNPGLDCGPVYPCKQMFVPGMAVNNTSAIADSLGRRIQHQQLGLWWKLQHKCSRTVERTQASWNSSVNGKSTHCTFRGVISRKQHFFFVYVYFIFFNWSWIRIHLLLITRIYSCSYAAVVKYTVILDRVPTSVGRAHGKQLHVIFVLYRLTPVHSHATLHPVKQLSDEFIPMLSRFLRRISHSRNIIIWHLFTRNHKETIVIKALLNVT